MKSAANGGLNLSVLDGWWVEGYDGHERLGDRRRGAGRRGRGRAGRRHAHALYDLLEQQVLPLFNERDEDGIPRRWLEMVKRVAQDERPALLGGAHGRRSTPQRIYPPAQR